MSVRPASRASTTSLPTDASPSALRLPGKLSLLRRRAQTHYEISRPYEPESSIYGTPSRLNQYAGAGTVGPRPATPQSTRRDRSSASLAVGVSSFGALVPDAFSPTASTSSDESSSGSGTSASVATVPAGSASGSLKGHRRMLSTRVKSLIGGLRRPRESDHDDAEPLAAFDEDDNEAANGSCASAFGAPLRPHRSPDAASFHATKSSSHPLDLDSPASITSFASQTTQASHGSHASPPSSPVVSLSPTRSSSPPPRTASYMSTDSPARVRVRPHARCGHRDSEDDDNDNDNAEDSNETPKRTQVTPRRPRTLPPPIAVRHPVQVTAQTPPARRPPREERTNMMTSLGLTPPTARSARLRTKLRVDTSRRPLALLEPLWSGKALRGKSPRAPLVLESHFSDTSDSDDDANTATTPSPSPMSPLVALQLTPTSPFRRPWSMFAPRRTKMETTVVA